MMLFRVMWSILNKDLYDASFRNLAVNSRS